MNNILNEFLNDEWFNEGDIIISSRSSGTYVKGRYVNGTETTETISVNKVIVPVTAKAIADAGIGEYGTGEVFSLWVEDALVFNSGSSLKKGDTVIYDGDKYKILSVLNYKTHDFYKYTLGLQREGTLND